MTRKNILLLAEGIVGNEVHLSLLKEEGVDVYLHALSSQVQVSNITEILSLAKENKIDEIIFATTHCSFASISHTLYQLHDLEIPIKISTRSITSDSKLRSLPNQDFVNLRSSNMTIYGHGIKWLIDKIGALLGLIVLSPLLLYTCWRVRRSSPGSVIYAQERIGRNGRPFKIYKFRSMYSDAERYGPQLSQTKDDRITPWGKIMRKYRLDELPQLWNVLVGDMSLVGPRPERAYFIEQLIEYEPQIYLLHTVRPGLTSWAMVNYGYACNVEQMRERLKYDWVYYEKMSLWFDIVVLFYTVRTVITGQGQ